MIDASYPRVMLGNIVRSWLAGVLTAIVAMGVLVATPHTASAATAPDLGDAENFAVLGGAGVTNTGTTVVTGDLGIAPVTGFNPPGVVVGTIHPTAPQAQADLTTAYNNLLAQGPATGVLSQLGTQTLGPGIYSPTDAGGAPVPSFDITGELTLDAGGDPNAVFIFKMESTLITAAGAPGIPASRVTLTGGAQACNVFWQVGSSATLGTYSIFAGNILAQAAITANTGAIVDGRLLAQTESVTLQFNTITASFCGSDPARSTTTRLTSSCALGQRGQVTLFATVTTPGPVPPTGAVEFFADGVSLGTAPIVNGRATLPVNLAQGVRRIFARYQGSVVLNPSNSPLLTQLVGPGYLCPVVKKRPPAKSSASSKQEAGGIVRSKNENFTGIVATSDRDKLQKKLHHIDTFVEHVKQRAFNHPALIGPHA
jgi:hypothetical protein